MTDRTAINLRKGETPNETTIQIGDLVLAFSYETVVAFATPETGWVTSENVWGPTTGKHLNRLPRGRVHERTPHGEFLERLEEALEARHLAAWPA